VRHDLDEAPFAAGHLQRVLWSCALMVVGLLR
jgi:hypothetical protein